MANVKVVGKRKTDKKLSVSRGPNRSKGQGMGYYFVALIMVMLLGAGWLLTGGYSPVDQAGPGGPPTLPPYYDPSDYGPQILISPTLGPGGSQQNLQLQNFNILDCSNPDIAVEFLIDTSGSMQYFGKMPKLQAALTSFTQHYPGLSGIGIETFGGDPGDVTQVLPFDYFKNTRPQVAQIIQGLKPFGGTPTRDGMIAALQNLTASIKANQFPNYKYALILLTDGVPEIPPSPTRQCEVQTPDPNLAPAERCFSTVEDPRIPTDIGAEIKGLGVSVYTIAITGPQGTSDYVLAPYLTAMLDQEATSPTASHALVTLNGDDLTTFLDSILYSVCQNPLGIVVTPTP